MRQILQHKWRNGIFIPLLAGIVLGILAPFGSSNFEPVFRFTYWIGMTLAGALGAMASSILMKRYAPDLPNSMQAIIRSFGATAAVSPFVFGLHQHMTGLSILMTLFYIWIVAIVITAFGMMAARSETETQPSAEIQTPPLLERLPPKFRDADLYAINSEDHYVRIHSSAGEHMILMRLSDAQDLASPLPGLKPHRSWWVAEAGVERVNRSDGKLRIQLKSGIEIPVSREGAKRVRSANWI